MPVNVATLELNDYIVYADKRFTGAAQVKLPRVDSCCHCGGVRFIFARNAEGGLDMVDDPEMALQLALINQGYNLRVNEERAAAGCFRNHDPHDGASDDWQYVEAVRPCVCEIAATCRAIKNGKNGDQKVETAA